MAEFSSQSEERAYLRRVARVLALKALFESDLSPHLPDEALERMIANVPVNFELVSPVSGSAPPLTESDLTETPLPEFEDAELHDIDSWSAASESASPVVAASFGGPDTGAVEADAAEAGAEPPPEEEEPATLGPMEPLSTAQAARVEEFARALVHGVESNRDAIDAVIAEVAPQWPLADLPVVDRNLLRIAIHEVLFARNTPVRAAINEAVDLAAEYGGDTSPRFVNGVLGTVARRYGKRGRSST